MLPDLSTNPPHAKRLKDNTSNHLHVCYLWHKRIIRIWICQQGADGQQDLHTDEVMLYNVFA